MEIRWLKQQLWLIQVMKLMSPKSTYHWHALENWVLGCLGFVVRAIGLLAV